MYSDANLEEDAEDEEDYLSGSQDQLFDEVPKFQVILTGTDKGSFKDHCFENLLITFIEKKLLANTHFMLFSRGDENNRHKAPKQIWNDREEFFCSSNQCDQMLE